MAQQDTNAAAREPAEAPRDFIRQKVIEDLRSGRFDRVVTRFPPEPNGYLHIGHAKAAWINYGIAREFGGTFHLRFDDTDPTKEKQEFVEAIQEDLRWLGCDWGEHLYYASDYFEQMYEYALTLVRAGLAYVDDQTPQEIRRTRGTLTSPGANSPYRDRSVEENLDLLGRMKSGEFADGARVLRAKIDMAHPNLNMRDPVMYRIVHATHPRRGDDWCLYPMYDWAHGLEDAIEGVTHSLCSLEFENHRPLYDWFLDRLIEHHPAPLHRPEQTEFARLNLTHTAMSKRYLRPLVESGQVAGWDDPRMPTICGLRRRGVPPEAIAEFCRRIGVNKFDSTVDARLLDFCAREHLNKVAPRVMGVLRPLKLVLTNYPEGQSEQLEAINNPEDPAAGTRSVPFSRELWIERDDFMENPPRKFYRLAPGREVRLRYAYFVTCTDVLKDDSGEVTEVHATYDPATRGGDAPDGRKVKATLHWVSAAHAVSAEVRLYDYLFAAEYPGRPAKTDAASPGSPAASADERRHASASGSMQNADAQDALGADDVLEAADNTAADWKADLNPNSLEVIPDAKVEPSVADRPAGWRCQLERLGYFCLDAHTAPGRPVLNRTVTLKDTWKKIQRRQGM